MVKNIKFNNQYINSIFSIAIIFSIIFGLIYNMRASQGMWRIFDDVHVVRTQEMAYELTQGQFPVRLLSRLGHGAGYMLFNFYSPLVYYLSSILVLIGTNPLNAVKIIFQICYLLAAIGMYAALKVLLPKKHILQVLGSILLIGSAYFNYDAYTRGALAELFGFSLIPWVLLAYEQIKRNNSLIWTAFLSLVMSGLIYAHAITAFIIVPFIILHFFIDWTQKEISDKHLLKYFLSAILTIGLSASYILPMWVEKTFVIYDQVDYVTNAAQSFISPAEIFGFARSTDPTIKPNTIGLPLSFFGFFGLVLSWFRFKKSRHKSEVIFISLALALTLFLQTNLSVWIWQHVSLIRLVQFPYRYETIFTILMILAGVYGLNVLKPAKSQFVIVCLVLGFSIYNNWEFFIPSGYYFASNYSAEDPCGTTTWQHEYLAQWTKQCVVKNGEIPLATSSGELVVNSFTTDQSNTWTLSTNGKPGELIIGKYYFPGWTITANNKNIPTYPYGPHGLVAATLSPDQEVVELKFKDSPIRTIGNIMSLISVVLVIITLLKATYLSLVPRLRRKNK